MLPHYKHEDSGTSHLCSHDSCRYGVVKYETTYFLIKQCTWFPYNNTDTWLTNDQASLVRTSEVPINKSWRWSLLIASLWAPWPTSTLLECLSWHSQLTHLQHFGTSHQLVTPANSRLQIFCNLMVIGGHMWQGFMHFEQGFLYYVIWPAFFKWYVDNRSLVQNTSKGWFSQIF